MRKSFAVVLCCIVSLTGCYHATIETGATPSTVVIEKSFASAWIYGLVPPSTVETAAKCPDGVAKVETQLSFVNQLVNIITFGIYTPMTIKVTCAAKKLSAVTVDHPDLTIVAGSNGETIRSTFSKAADLAVQDGRVIFVQVTQ